MVCLLWPEARSRPARSGFTAFRVVRVSREKAAVLLFDDDRAFRALVSGFFATAGVFARVGIDHVREAVVADLEHIGADILTDTAPGAKIGIDFGHTHGSPPLGLSGEPI
jgi:hypothetical protein